VGQKQRVDMLQHHYSVRLNGCFVMLHTKVTDPNNGREQINNDQLAIWDVNDYERGPVADFIGYPRPENPKNFFVTSCYAIDINNLHDLKFDHCDHGYIPTRDLALDIPPKWNALIKPFMEE